MLGNQPGQQYYWDGTECVLRNSIGEPCDYDYQCTANVHLICTNNICSCKLFVYVFISD